MHDIIVGSKLLSVGKRIGKGGEGEVFAIKGRSDVVAKIYTPRLRSKREEKVRAMVQGRFFLLTDLVAYPIEVVFDRRGDFLGFLMRFVSGYRPIHQLYSPKSRQRFFAKADYRFVIRAALNVASAVGKVHQTECVIGDLNHSGILISQDARAAVIDADSFQFFHGQKIFPCGVGVPEFTPPELQRVNLEEIARSKNHDNFSLAIAIFHLLFMGRHPYAGLHEGPDLPIGQAISQNKFAYSLTRRSSTGVSPPPGVLPLEIFPPSIRYAFERAFGLDYSSRPSPLDWVNVLKALERSFSKCGTVKTHFFPNSTTNCPWCKLSRNTGGIDMFPAKSATVPYPSGSLAATENEIREILAYKFPVVADLVPKSMLSMQAGSDKLKAAKDSKFNQVVLGILMLAGAGVGMYYDESFWLIWFGLGGFGAILMMNRKVDKTPFRNAFTKADEALTRELKSFISRNGLTEVARVRGDLEIAIPSYRSIDEEHRKELIELKSTRRERHLAAFLDRYSIRNANISGIGPSRTAMLVSFGIETAADVSRWKVMGVPSIGPVLTKSLLDWRKKLERRFRYNPNRNSQDIKDENKVNTHFARRKTELEMKIKNGLKILRVTKPNIDALPTIAGSDEKLLHILKIWLQAAQDLKLLGVANSNLDIDSKTVFEPQQWQHRSKPVHTGQLF